MNADRYLTKSRFKLAQECPTKLFYTNKPYYADQKIDDDFLLALAEGGFQVGELAKCYVPEGKEITTLDKDEALALTRNLLELGHVTIFEAAIRYEDFFIRADILVKDGRRIDLFEVKSKSIDGDGDANFLTKRDRRITSEWLPYLEDIAFQKHVVSSAFPECDVHAFLMLMDKNSVCPSEGLHQKFKIVKDGHGRKRAERVGRLSETELSERLLVAIPVDTYCSMIFQARYGEEGALSFAELADFYATSYREDRKIPPRITGECKTCEFRTNESSGPHMKSGYHECWKEALGWTDEDFLAPTVLDIWNFRRKQELLDQRIVKMSQVDKRMIDPDGKSGPEGLSVKDRQWLQVQKVRTGDSQPWVDRANLRRQMESWKYPLHFIDFETTLTAIPFNKGRHPYELLAFQYSHHTVDADGRIAHAGQYLHTAVGDFPSHEFLRHLKRELDRDEGTVFRYSHHENTVLNTIHRQLEEDPSQSDREELCAFIRSLTQSGRASDIQWIGSRSMVDMCELVKRYWYDPATRGSNSIKQVLPALLNGSKYLQEKYSEPIYGTEEGIPSHNFRDHRWITWEKGRVVDPYKLLPKMFLDVSDQTQEILLMSDSDDLHNGGAALTAYCRMQFEEMSAYERQEIAKALLKYCELDTFAMVMLYEGWREMVRS